MHRNSQNILDNKIEVEEVIDAIQFDTDLIKQWEIFKKRGIIMELKEIEQEIKNIKARNKRVELDKKWETSWTRKICICILTYIVVIIYSYVIRNSDNIFLSSLVPVIGFTLSTLSLSFVRKVWEKKNK